MFKCASQIARIARFGVDSAQSLVRRHYDLTELLRPGQNYNTRWQFARTVRSNSLVKKVIVKSVKIQLLENYNKKLELSLLEKDQKIKDLKENIELLDMLGQLTYIERYAFAIEDFVLEKFELLLHYSDYEYEVLRTTLTKFFMEPSEDQKSLSTLMKRQILDIEELKDHDISQVIDRLLHVYTAFVSMMTNKKYRDFGYKTLRAYMDCEKWNPREHEWFNRNNLQSLLDKAPALQVYDEKLRRILLSQIKSD